MDIKNTISSTEARKKFAEVIDNIGRGSARYTLTVNGKPRVVMMNAEEFEGWIETNDILSDPKLVAGIKRGQADIKAGRVHSFKEVFGENPAEVLEN